MEQSSATKTIRRFVIAVAIVNDRNDPDQYAICECQNCGRFFVASRDHHWEDWQPVWPLATETVSSEVPEKIRDGLREAHLCRAVEAYSGCLLMCRTTVIRLLRDRSVANLKELAQRGFISAMLYGQADETRLWANMVGHDDFDPDKVKPEAVEELVAYIAALVHAVYVEPARLAALKAARAQAEAEEEESD